MKRNLDGEWMLLTLCRLLHIDRTFFYTEMVHPRGNHGYCYAIRKAEPLIFCVPWSLFKVGQGKSRIGCLERIFGGNFSEWIYLNIWTFINVNYCHVIHYSLRVITFFQWYMDLLYLLYLIGLDNFYFIRLFIVPTKVRHVKTAKLKRKEE